MEPLTFLVLLVIVVVVLSPIIAIVSVLFSRASPEEKQAELEKIVNALDTLEAGSIKPEILCPHCQEKGHVRTKSVQEKAGISGGKATAAVLTGGLSVLATGLSRKQKLTKARCDHCKSTWHF